MDINIDRRAARTKKAIKRAMFELLKKKDISKITVSELSDLADIGRGTFYLHYADPYGLLDKLEDELLEQVTANAPPIIEHRDSAGLLNHLENIWLYIYENKEAFAILLNRHNGGRFMEKFRRYCENIALEGYSGTTAGPDDKRAAAIHGNDPAPVRDYDNFYNVIYIISGSLGIFLKWMEEDAPIPPDRLAQIVRNLITGGDGV